MLRKRVVLFVDDERGYFGQVREALEGLPIDLLFSDNPREALDMVGAHGVDIVLSDHEFYPNKNLPPGPGPFDGSELLNQVRVNHPYVDRTLVTAHSDFALLSRAVQLGAPHNFVPKPFDLSFLRLAVSDAITRVERRDGASENAFQLQWDARTRMRHYEEAMATLRVYYQPIVRARTRHIVGYEALMRSESKILNNPEHLLEVAESLGKQRDLEREIRKIVARDFPRCPDQADIWVNVSPDCLLDHTLVDGIEMLTEYADRVVLEITERRELPPSIDPRAVTNRLRSQGYRIALDDMGAGLSGLARLADVKPDIVKFDRSLCESVHQDVTRARLLQSMASVCQEYRMRVVGEGVESEAAAQRLEELEFDLLQGFCFARPTYHFAEDGDGVVGPFGRVPRDPTSPDEPSPRR